LGTEANLQGSRGEKKNLQKRRECGSTLDLRGKLRRKNIFGCKNPWERLLYKMINEVKK
jgi:hypothetical protein